MKKRILAIAIVLLVTLGMRPSAQAVPVLKNTGFEEGFRNYDNVGELTVANHWAPWYSREYKRPEFKPEIPTIGKGRVRSGQAAQKFFTTFSAHDGGIYQEIYGVQPDSWYAFSIWGYQWSSSKDNPDSSEGDGKCSVLVGINPWGDANALARTTVWGKEALQVYNKWVKVDVTAQAWSTKITVVVRQVCEWPTKHNDAYLDDAALGLATPSGPVPTPCPTPTSCPACPTPAAPAVCPSVSEIRTVIREEIDKTAIQVRIGE